MSAADLTVSDKKMNYRFFYFYVFFISLLVRVPAQEFAKINGYVRDTSGIPLELVHVAIENTSIGTITDKNGFFQLTVPARRNINVVFSIIGYQTQRHSVFLQHGEKYTLQVILKKDSIFIAPVEIVFKTDDRVWMQKIEPKNVRFLPVPDQSIEKLLLLTASGVYATSELSSTYSVRGGNFDENLVYVNGVEIYRPFLIRSGQQEGLSFINPDLVDNVYFSSGGFNASYGDKMSSVLDVQYKKPQKFRASITTSFLSSQLHAEGASKDTSFTFLTGIRYKSNTYLLSSLENKGEYKPMFGDIQNYLEYHFSKRTKISWLSYASLNKYRFIPQTRETSYGTINDAYRLTIYFDGQEIDQFDILLNALIFTYQPNNHSTMKLIASSYHSHETETFDILGQYWLGKLEIDLGKPDFGEVAENRGVGAFHNYARNELFANVFSLELRGTHALKAVTMTWGVKTQHERIYDNLYEWTYIDSAGFSLPTLPDSIGYVNPSLQPYQYLTLYDTIFSEMSLFSFRNSGFVQFTKLFQVQQHILNTEFGVRMQHWNVNQQLIASPRFSVSYYQQHWKKLQFKFATGFYHQPPFYRELRDLRGNLIKDIKAQQSVHILGGVDIKLTIWERPFRFTSEIYYKHLQRLIPFVSDNVRIRYLPELTSKGYATGIDLKFSGQLVPDVDSWINLSIMKTAEDIINDYYVIYYNSDGERIIPGYTLNNVPVDSTIVYPGYIPRPTDQRVMFSMFFQDYLPNNPTLKMHLGVYFASGMPFGPPGTEKYKHTLRMPSYKRVDIGFSKLLTSEVSDKKGILKHIKSAWISLEVFNLLQMSNTVSYLWIMDVTGRRYAVPNYLTPRLLNLKFFAEF